jgi:endonuclease-3 related protein
MKKSELEMENLNFGFDSAIRNPKSEILMMVYRKLFRVYGPRHWWPGETSFEVMVGAILTQNTSWRNVEKAIQRLKDKGVLNPEGIHHLRKSQLASLIKSSGYYRIKASRLKSFVDFLYDEYGGDIEKMRELPLGKLREKLLGVKGIGPETADSILLYGLRKTIFVVDAYTKRILSRHGLISEKASYEEVQNLFMDHLPRDEKLFNEYHALFVHLGKTVCKKIPKCELCPLQKVGNGKWDMGSETYFS